jgi:CheY-like chemotaxis protein
MTGMARTARILLVDDNANDVELTLDAFTEALPAYPVEVARSGRAALDHLFGRMHGPDGGRPPLPDLILLDLKMPGVDGLEVLRQVKAAPVLRRIPVVILTSSREDGDRAMSYDTGANSYLVKPISFGGMLDVVRTIGDYWLTVNVGPPLPGAADVEPA